LDFYATIAAFSWFERISGIIVVGTSLARRVCAMLLRYTYELVMKSTNFEFLRTPVPNWRTLARSPKTTVFSDPVSALVKLRTFAESMVSAIFSHHGFVRPQQAMLFEFPGRCLFQESHASCRDR
jgi:hypothetical protein